MINATINVLESSVGATPLGGIQIIQDGSPVKVGKQFIVDSAGAEIPFATETTLVAILAALGTSAAQVLTPGVVYNYTKQGNISLMVESLSGGDNISVTGSLTPAGTQFPLQVISDSGTLGTISNNITTPGIYSVSGFKYIVVTHSGSGSTPVVTASASA
jgi:hypothetical protein